MTGTSRQRAREWLRGKAQFEDGSLRWLVVLEAVTVGVLLADPRSRPDATLRWVTWLVCALAISASCLAAKWLPTVRALAGGSTVTLLAFAGMTAGTTRNGLQRGS